MCGLVLLHVCVLVLLQVLNAGGGSHACPALPHAELFVFMSYMLVGAWQLKNSELSVKTTQIFELVSIEILHKNTIKSDVGHRSIIVRRRHYCLNLFLRCRIEHNKL